MTTNKDRAAELLYNEGCGSGDTAHYIARRLADAGLLTPDPQPRTLKDMTPEEREACQWMQARDDVGNRVVITELNEGGQEGTVLYENGKQYEWPYSILVPLPDLPRMEWPDEQATTHDDEGMAPEVEEGTYGKPFWEMVTKVIRDEKEYHIDAQDYEGVKRWRDAERALHTAMEANPPKESPVPTLPEGVKPDPQPGEAWLIEYEGKRYEAVYWYSPIYAHWAFVESREGLKTVESPEATPVSRLVSEVEV